MTESPINEGLLRIQQISNQYMNDEDNDPRSVSETFAGEKAAYAFVLHSLLEELPKDRVTLLDDTLRKLISGSHDFSQFGIKPHPFVENGFAFGLCAVLSLLDKGSDIHSLNYIDP